MLYRQLGNTGTAVSNIALGSMYFGSETPENDAFAILDTSLQRLDLETIDLYQLHASDMHAPVEETLSFLDEAVKAGKVHYIGLSNFTGWQLQLMVSTAKGKYQRGGKPPTDSRAGSEKPLYQWVSEEYARSDRNWTVIDAVVRIAKDIGATPAQVALSWIADRPGVIAPIVGARTVEHLRGNLGAAELTLESAAAAELEKLSLPQSNGYPYGAFGQGQRARWLPASGRWARRRSEIAATFPVAQPAIAQGTVMPGHSLIARRPRPSSSRSFGDAREWSPERAGTGVLRVDDRLLVTSQETIDAFRQAGASGAPW